MLCSIAHCKECHLNLSCATCDDGYKDYLGSCVKECDVNCASGKCLNSSGTCTECQSSFTLDTKTFTCFNCSVSNCLTCSSNNFCVVCKDTFLVNATGACECPKHSFSINNNTECGCLQPNQTYDYNPTNIDQGGCRDNCGIDYCINCNSTAKTCVACTFGYRVLDNACI